MRGHSESCMEGQFQPSASSAARGSQDVMSVFGAYTVPAHLPLTEDDPPSPTRGHLPKQSPLYCHLGICETVPETPLFLTGGNVEKGQVRLSGFLGS